jgi:hypothetical protein
MNPRSGPAPLPRSLDPLTGESLPGYLLRLSRRLRLPPGYLAQRTGLTAGGSGFLGARHLLDLAPLAAAAFAQATRLDADEVTALTLAPLRLHYPPIAASAQPGRVSADPWLLTSASRYCPACLAGDGSPIQDQLGGAWKRSWRLPVVFICPQHQVFLHHRCHRCRQPQGNTRSGRLLLRPGDPGLHPAQCRASPHAAPGRSGPACAHRLDDTGTSGQDLDPSTQLLEFQTRLTDLLDPRRPAAPAAQHFTDLQVVTALIRATWPHSSDLITADLADAAQRNLDQQEHTDSPRQRRLQVLLSPPLEAAACAALLHAADTVLTTPNLREALAPLIASLATGTCRVSRSPWARVFVRNSDTCSPRLQQAAEPLVRAYRRTGGRPQGTRAPLRRGGFRPEHIAAYLQQDWYDQHFSHLDTPSVKTLRRTAAVCLVQMAAGGSLGDAAEYLGINPHRTQFTTASAVRSWARTQTDPAGFDSALHALAGELDAAPALINYRHRRTALLDWYLAGTDWQELIIRLPPTPGPVQPVLDDRRRQDASNLVWTRVTQGEHLFAPRPLQALQPAAVQEHWEQRRHTTWHQLTRQKPLQHYADLRDLLIAQARTVASSIDRSAS